MFTPQTLENKRIIKHISADLEWTLEKESNDISNDMETIDKIVRNFDKIYKELETGEIKYKGDSENLFIAIQYLVSDINQCVGNFQHLQNNLKRVRLTIASHGRMRKLLSYGSGIGSIKVDKVPSQVTHVQLFTFPNNPLGGEHFTGRNTPLKKIF